jgi:hypothetical protein
MPRSGTFSLVTLNALVPYNKGVWGLSGPDSFCAPAARFSWAFFRGFRGVSGEGPQAVQKKKRFCLTGETFCFTMIPVKRITVNVDLNPELKKQLESLAKTGNVTVAWVVRDILTFHLRSLPKKLQPGRRPGVAPDLFPHEGASL